MNASATGSSGLATCTARTNASHVEVYQGVGGWWKGGEAQMRMLAQNIEGDKTTEKRAPSSQRVLAESLRGSLLDTTLKTGTRELTNMREREKKGRKRGKSVVVGLLPLTHARRRHSAR